MGFFSWIGLANSSSNDDSGTNSSNGSAANTGAAGNAGSSSSASSGSAASGASATAAPSPPVASVPVSEAEAAAIGEALFAGVEAFPGPDIIITDATDFDVIVPARSAPARSSGAGASAQRSPPTPAQGALLHGNICAARDSAVLAAHSIRLIVQCAEEFSAGKPGAPPPLQGVRVLDLNLSDTTTQRLGDAVAAALPLMAAVRAAGGGVLVNCMAGISRSTSVVLAHLMDHTQVDLRTAWLQVRAARPKACPNVGFAIQLMGMEAAQRGGRCSIPPAALRASPLYNFVFESDSEGQRFIANALRNAQ